MLISVVTMTVGNVAALTQTNMKRLLAYSSIAHAGYLLMGVVALSENGARALLVYLAAYLVMNLGAFLVVTLVHLHDGSFDLRDYPGLYRRAPLLTWRWRSSCCRWSASRPSSASSASCTSSARSSSRATACYAVVGAVNAAIAAYYYFRVLKVMMIDAGNEDKPALHAGPRRPRVADGLRGREPAAAPVLGAHRRAGSRARWSSTPVADAAGNLLS